MSCDCRRGSTCADHLDEADLTLEPTYPNLASCEERVRLLRDQERKDMQTIAELRCAFADCLLALEELGHTDVAARLRERWPEAQA